MSWLVGRTFYFYLFFLDWREKIQPWTQVFVDRSVEEKKLNTKKNNHIIINIFISCPLKISFQVINFIRNNITRSLTILGTNKMDVIYCLLSNISVLLSAIFFHSSMGWMGFFCFFFSWPVNFGLILAAISTFFDQLGPCFTWSTFPSLTANLDTPTAID